MRRIIFYSWQSDLPNACNRGFVQAALEESARAIVADNTIEVEPVVDRDTQGVPGSPDIGATIFGKISAADIFVADVSIVTRATDLRPTPNPNVLIELGYALKALGPERIVLVFNKAFGDIPELPFDLRMRRVLVYDMPEDAKTRAPERKKLQASLETAIRAALTTVPAASDADTINPAIAAVENSAGNRRLILRRSLDEILRTIQSLEPRKPRDGGTVEELLAAISDTQPVAAEFSKISEAIAVMDDEDSVLEVYRWFGKIFDQYDTPPGFSGRLSTADHDFFKFVGHELFVSFIGFLIREQRWALVARVLDEPIPMQNLDHRPGNANWQHASEHLPSLLDEGRRRQRMSLHADLLHDRHTGSGGLATVLPMQDLMNADFFLFLLSRTLKDETVFDRHYWRAWSCLYLKQAPKFVLDSSFKRIAEQVAGALGLSVDEYKTLLAARGPEMARLFSNGWWDYPIEQHQVDQIATK